MNSDQAGPDTARSARPRVLVLGTGGTIAGSSAAARGRAYEAGALAVEDLLTAVPGLADRAELTTEQVFSLDSVDITLTQRLHVARRIDHALAQAETAGAPLAGVVVTHGTDTLEDTAFCLHQVLTTDVPVVVTGAMRPADAPGADGPANLTDAVTAACSPAARGLGTLAVMAGQVHAGAQVRKRSAAGVEAFASEWGPLGEVTGGALHLFTRPSTIRGAFPVAQLPASLPEVVTLLDYPELPTAVREAVLTAAPAGLVHVGTGAGNVDAATRAFLARARDAGIVVVRVSATGGGVVARGGAVDDDALGTVAGGRHSPASARILLTLALTDTHTHRDHHPDPNPERVAAVQRIFDQH